MRMRVRLLGLLAATALLLPSPAFAQSSWLYEIRAGVLVHDVPIVACCRTEDSVSLNAELAFAPSLPLFGGAIRPVLGGSFTPGGQTSFVYLDARWEWSGSLFFFGVGVGPAIQTGDNLYVSSSGHKALGSRVLFHIPLEIGIQVTPQHRISAYYEHVSNGYTSSPNPGMDNLGIRLSHRF